MSNLIKQEVHAHSCSSRNFGSCFFRWPDANLCSCSLLSESSLAVVFSDPTTNKQQQSVCPGQLLFIIGISAYFCVFSLCFQLSTISAGTLRAFGKSRKNKPCSPGKKNTSVTFFNDWAEGFTQTPRPDCAVTKSPFFGDASRLGTAMAPERDAADENKL